MLIACYLVYSLRVHANDAIRFVRHKRPNSVQTSSQVQVLLCFNLLAGLVLLIFNLLAGLNLLSANLLAGLILIVLNLLGSLIWLIFNLLASLILLSFNVCMYVNLIILLGLEV